jgi:hypothetical protein
MLENWSHVKIHAMIQFSEANHISAPEIHCQLIEVYDKTVMSHHHVPEWCKTFNAGTEKITDMTVTVERRAL